MTGREQGGSFRDRRHALDRLHARRMRDDLIGDRLQIRNGRVILNGKPQKEPFIRPCQGSDGCDFPTEITVPAGHYFMMGDNRGSSDDSRFWGPVQNNSVIGVAFFTYWPPDRIGTL